MLSQIEAKVKYNADLKKISYNSQCSSHNNKQQ